MPKIKINNLEIMAEDGSSVLQAARNAGIIIPTLCYLKDIHEEGVCRTCLVEIDGEPVLKTACNTKVTEDMTIKTESENISFARKEILKTKLLNHDKNCVDCERSRTCYLTKLCEAFDVLDAETLEKENFQAVDNFSVSVVRDLNKCIACGRCVNVCKYVQASNILYKNEEKNRVYCNGDIALAETNCVNCGQCIVNCPTAALSEKDDTEKVWKALLDKNKTVIVQTAPSIRVALGEEFNLPTGKNVQGKMITALKKLGFDKIFDTNTGADFTIVEEASEFVERFKSKKNLPIITSCSPAWVKFCEHNFPHLLNNLSTCKSPHTMFGAVIKSYYAEKMKINPSDIIVVSIMPCTAKKFEAQRAEMKGTDFADVDIVITTRELAKMIRGIGLDFESLEESVFDDPMGEASGAGAIFGVTGGVMEAALRSASEYITGKSFEKLEFEEVRSLKGIKEATINIAGENIKVAVASGLSNAKNLLEHYEDYHMIEIMGCPGGCVNGGGQPIVSNDEKNFGAYIQKRADSLYEADEKLSIRKSHENPILIKIYDEYLGKPNSEKAHKLLHTHYHER